MTDLTRENPGVVTGAGLAWMERALAAEAEVIELRAKGAPRLPSCGACGNDEGVIRGPDGVDRCDRCGGET